MHLPHDNALFRRPGFPFSLRRSMIVRGEATNARVCLGRRSVLFTTPSWCDMRRRCVGSHSSPTFASRGWMHCDRTPNETVGGGIGDNRDWSVVFSMRSHRFGMLLLALVTAAPGCRWFDNLFGPGRPDPESAMTSFSGAGLATTIARRPGRTTRPCISSVAITS